MAVPKRKVSPSRRGMRRSADALKAPTYVEDKDSGELRRPHHIDLKSGMYKGRQVLKPKVPVRRIVFHEITEDAVKEALARGTPRASSVGNIAERIRRSRSLPVVLPVELPDDPRIKDLRVLSHDPKTYDALTRTEANDDDR